jgi:O-antigen/teichoic acid export membrane protein
MKRIQIFKEKVRKYLIKLSGRLEIDARYFVKGGFWLFFQIGATYLIGLIRSILFARLLDKTTYGQFGFVIDIANTVSIFTLPGIGTALVETTARGYYGSFKDAVRARVRWSFLASLIMAGVSIYQFWIDKYDVALALLITGALLPLTSATSVVQAYYTGRKQFEISSTINLGVLILTNTALALILFLGKGVIWLVIANSIPQLITQLILYWHINNQTKGAPSDPELVDYGKSLTLAEAIISITAHLDSVILGLSSEFTNVAIYRIASVLPKSIRRLPKSLVSLLMPKIAEHPNKKIYSARTRRHLLFLWTLNTLLAVGVAAVLGHLIPFLYGEEYNSAVVYARLLMISIIPAGPNSFFIAALRTRKKTKAIYTANMIYSVIRIITLISLIPLFGVLGIVISNIVCRWSEALYRWYAVTKL